MGGEIALLARETTRSDSGRWALGPDVGVREVQSINQAICIRGVEEAEMAFFESWSHPVYIPVIPEYTERLKLNAGLKLLCVLIFVSV